MLIIEALKKKKYLAIAIISAIAIGILFPVIQVGFLLNVIDVWFSTLLDKPLNTILYFTFSAVFGIMVAFQIFNLKECKTCKINVKSTSGAFGGATFGFIFGICPACVGLIGLILPLGASIALNYYGWIFTTIAIVIMLYAINVLGGFKND